MLLPAATPRRSQRVRNRPRLAAHPTRSRTKARSRHDRSTGREGDRLVRAATPQERDRGPCAGRAKTAPRPQGTGRGLGRKARSSAEPQKCGQILHRTLRGRAHPHPAPVAAFRERWLTTIRPPVRATRLARWSDGDRATGRSGHGSCCRHGRRAGGRRPPVGESFGPSRLIHAYRRQSKCSSSSSQADLNSRAEQPSMADRIRAARDVAVRPDRRDCVSSTPEARNGVLREARRPRFRFWGYVSSGCRGWCAVAGRHGADIAPGWVLIPVVIRGMSRGRAGRGRGLASPGQRSRAGAAGRGRERSPGGAGGRRSGR